MLHKTAGHSDSVIFFKTIKKACRNLVIIRKLGDISSQKVDKNHSRIKTVADKILS